MIALAAILVAAVTVVYVVRSDKETSEKVVASIVVGFTLLVVLAILDGLQYATA